MVSIMDIKDLQKAVDEIRDVCRKHGIVLIGHCWSEALWSEILVLERDKLDDDARSRVGNVVHPGGLSFDPAVTGIG